jgi:hypothetical protein
LHIPYNHDKVDLLNGYDKNITIWLNNKGYPFRLNASCDYWDTIVNEENLKRASEWI